VAERHTLPDNAIIVARSMGPAALLDYDRSRLRGLVLEEGGPTSHIAIVARALGIPAVGEVENATAIVEPGDAIIVDGATGEIHLRPRPDVEAAYAEKARLRARRQEQYRALRDQPAVTQDGVEVQLQINAGLLVDLPHLSETGASGIGLFRTELQFMIAERMPTSGEQQALYNAVYEAAGELPVTFRTLDIGGDKILPYMQAVEEENPALGWRAIRIGLDRPGLLGAQLRRAPEAAAGGPCASCSRWWDVRRVLPCEGASGREQAYLSRLGILPSMLELGVMLESPRFCSSAEIAACDFLSVGSNGPPAVTVRRGPGQIAWCGEPLRTY
jgi:phosphotransferase system enzyme I (PtsP)